MQSARAVYFRLTLGVVFKWLMVVLVWMACMPVIAKAPLAALLGMMATIAVQPIVAIFGTKVKREL